MSVAHMLLTEVLRCFPFTHCFRWTFCFTKKLWQTLSCYLQYGATLLAHLRPRIVAAGGAATGPVYSAVGLPRSKGKRGCVQGLINHGCFGRDKQAKPSRDAAAPAASGGGGQSGGRGEGTVGGVGRPEGVSLRRQWTKGYTITLAVWFHICTAVQACKSTFLVWPDANRARCKCVNPRSLLQTVLHRMCIQNDTKSCPFMNIDLVFSETSDPDTATVSRQPGSMC